MSEYKGIARWSENAVGMINWDDTAKEGTAQVTDEKTGEVYQIGGGGDLIDLEYTFDNDIGIIELSKTPAELKQLIEAGKNFKFVCSAELAEVTLMSEGDTYICVSYNLLDNVLSELIFNRLPLPTFYPDDAATEWRGIMFTNISGTMTVSFD